MEYTLPAVLVLVASIATLSAFGISLKGIGGTINKQMEHQISSVKTGDAQHADAKADFILEQQLKASQAAASGSMNTSQLCSGSACSTTLDLNASVVNTVGSNGQVAQLSSQAADIFTVVAQQLAAQGADNALITLVTNLANTGHSIANGENNLSGDFSAMSGGISAIQDGRSNFQTLYSQLTPQMSKLPANSRTQVAKAAKVIMTIANNYTFTLTSNNAQYNYQASSADLTTINANTICTNGGDTSSCVQ